MILQENIIFSSALVHGDSELLTSALYARCAPFDRVVFFML